MDVSWHTDKAGCIFTSVPHSNVSFTHVDLIGRSELSSCSHVQHRGACSCYLLWWTEISRNEWIFAVLAEQSDLLRSTFLMFEDRNSWSFRCESPLTRCGSMWHASERSNNSSDSVSVNLIDAFVWNKHFPLRVDLHYVHEHGWSEGGWSFPASSSSGFLCRIPAMDGSGLKLQSRIISDVRNIRTPLCFRHPHPDSHQLYQFCWKSLHKMWILFLKM